MSNAAFMGDLKSYDTDPNGPVYESIWAQYEKVIFQSLITSFGLDLFIKDQTGGDVDTIYNVRKTGEFKNQRYEDAYENRGEYNSSAYHQHAKYKEINRKVSEAKKSGQLVDTYTGKKVPRNAKMDLDHVIAAKEIHDDPGRVLAGLKGEDLANCEENLKPTHRSINRSMKQDDMDEYLVKWEERRPERQARIQELQSKGRLSDKERKELGKLEELEKIDPNRMRAENQKARAAYDKKLERSYYTSRNFALDTTRAATKTGVKMGVRQVVGFIFTEVWFAAKKEMEANCPGCHLKEILESIGRGIKKGFENAKRKYKQLIEKFLEGLGAGILSSITTTICNIFFTTAKNLARCIRQIYASVVEAGKVLLFNPQNLPLGDRLKQVTIILGTGASVLVGIGVGEAVAKTPLGMLPVVGEIVQTFVSTLVSGLLSCSLIVFLDRSQLINQILSALNTFAGTVQQFAEIAKQMELIAAKLAKLDIEQFERETAKFRSTVEAIEHATDEKQLNDILKDAYKKFDIKIPWEGDFHSFMSNRNNRLVFE